MLKTHLNKEPYFSVIIPAYNAENFIERAIESVQKQSFSNWELIIVENGSTDHTTEICSRYIKDNKVFLTHSERGVSRARNKGMSLVRGKWVVFLDADDVLLNNALSSFYEIDNIYEPDLINGKLFIQGKDYSGSIAIYKDKTLNNYLKQCLELPTQKCNIAGTAFKRVLIEKNKVLFEQNIHYAEDSLFYLQVLSYCLIIVSIDSPVYKVFYYLNSAVRSGKKCLDSEYLPAINKIGSLLDLKDQEIRNYWYLFTLNQLLVILVNDVFARKESIRKQKNDARKVMEISEFKNAIDNVDLSVAHGVNKVMFFMMKKRMMAGISIAAHYKRNQNIRKAKSQNV